MGVSTLWDVGLISDQAVTGSLFLSSTILLLKLVMNYYLQSFPFILIERMTVVSYWQNPTPGPFVSIRWEHLGIISLPSSPINSKCGPSWVTIWLAHMSPKTHVYSVHVSKEVYQRTNFSQITYKASSGEMMHF